MYLDAYNPYLWASVFKRTELEQASFARNPYHRTAHDKKQTELYALHVINLKGPVNFGQVTSRAFRSSQNMAACVPDSFAYHKFTCFVDYFGWMKGLETNCTAHVPEGSWISFACVPMGDVETWMFLRSTKWNANLILLRDYAGLVVLCKVIVWKTHIPVRTQK